MKTVVIYKSKYGTTKTYAGWIAEELDADLKEHGEIQPGSLDTYDIVIYGGGLYAGGISGVQLVAKNKCNHLIIFTVGLADPGITDYSGIINKGIPAELREKVKVFHLRGGIDYKKLGIVHKGMMAVMKKMTEKKSPLQSDSEDMEFLETYGKSVDFTDKHTIKPLVDYVMGLGSD